MDHPVYVLGTFFYPYAVYVGMLSKHNVYPASETFIYVRKTFTYSRPIKIQLSDVYSFRNRKIVKGLTFKIL